MVNRKNIMRLLHLKAQDHMVISFYMGIGVYKSKRKAYEIEAKDIIKAAITEADINVKFREEVEADAKRILDFLKMDFGGRARGLAIFACAPENLWQVYRLPVTVPDRCVIDRVPFVMPMLKIVDEGRRFCVIVTDKEKARIFTLYLGEMMERTDLFDVVPGWHKQGGWSQARYQRHIEDHVNKHLKHVADSLFDFYKREGFGHLIIGGSQEIRTRLHRILHSYLQQVFRGFISVEVTSSVDEIAEAASRIVEETEKEQSKELTRRILEPKGQHITVSGLKETIKALEQGRVHTLVLVDNQNIHGSLCTRCEKVDLPGTKVCSLCQGEMNDVEDVSEYLARLAVEQDAEVNYVTNGFGLERVDGIGAILRW